MSVHESAAVVRREHCGPVLLVTIDNPPVNALGVDVRRGLIEAMAAADTDAAVRAVLIVGSGRNFIAGADLREFGKPPQAPSLDRAAHRKAPAHK